MGEISDVVKYDADGLTGILFLKQSCFSQYNANAGIVLYFKKRC